MSVVTGVALIVQNEQECVTVLQAWLRDRGRGQMRDVADGAGGRKHPQFELFAMGVNGFHDEDEFARLVLAQPWQDPGNVVLVLQPEEGWTRVFRPVSNDMLRAGDQIDANTLYDADAALELLRDAAQALGAEQRELRARIVAFVERSHSETPPRAS